MKKKLTLVVTCIVLVAAMVIGGTLAYFTDTDKADNVFTTGNVKIELVEQQRDGKGGLEDFKDGKKLMPIVGSAQGEKDKYGMPTAKNYVDKIINVKNLAEDAYVRVYFAVPTALLDEKGLESGNLTDNALHSNLGNRFDPTGAGRYNTKGQQDTWNPDFLNWDYSKPLFETTIAGVKYTVTTFTYTKVLSKDDVTGAACVTGFYLDDDVDYVQGENGQAGYYTMLGEKLDYDFSNGVTIPVYAIGVQAEGFTSADQAFDAAFGADYNPWAK